MPCRKRNRKGLLVTDILSKVNTIYELSVRTTLNNPKEAGRLALMEDQVDDDEGPVELIVMRIGIYLMRKRREIFMTYRIMVLEAHLRYKLSWTFAVKYNVNEPADLVGAQAITGDGISLISRFVELTDQLGETKETCLTHKKDHLTEIAQLNVQDSQPILL